MENHGEYTMIITTCADSAQAKGLARRLLCSRLAACVQIYPVESMYFWRGELCEDNEAVLFIKTRAALFDKITAAISECHAYETPEIIQLPITDGLPEYFRFIDKSTEEKEE